ncbi:hypothetical protein M011DRAFT_476958 [Sporormia fimetaria CBS 119925]|uniref:Uncharacterized protein n=1 Tax=Sporormia fimetaria CBS 119925 TaxID=1340428 RepID=A0A6A6VFC3_9PLEO|nr:hypothetical protein M011DRAFT_476958 [Sporormia fimetaria CBS 119925]
MSQRRQTSGSDFPYHYFRGGFPPERRQWGAITIRSPPSRPAETALPQPRAVYRDQNERPLWHDQYAAPLPRTATEVRGLPHDPWQHPNHESGPSSARHHDTDFGQVGNEQTPMPQNESPLLVGGQDTMFEDFDIIAPHPPSHNIHTYPDLPHPGPAHSGEHETFESVRQSVLAERLRDIVYSPNRRLQARVDSYHGSTEDITPATGNDTAAELPVHTEDLGGYLDMGTLYRMMVELEGEDVELPLDPEIYLDARTLQQSRKSTAAPGNTRPPSPPEWYVGPEVYVNPSEREQLDTEAVNSTSTTLVGSSGSTGQGMDQTELSEVLEDINRRLNALEVAMDLESIERSRRRTRRSELLSSISARRAGGAARF